MGIDAVIAVEFDADIDLADIERRMKMDFDDYVFDGFWPESPLGRRATSKARRVDAKTCMRYCDEHYGCNHVDIVSLAFRLDVEFPDGVVLYGTDLDCDDTLEPFGAGDRLELLRLGAERDKRKSQGGVR